MVVCLVVFLGLVGLVWGIIGGAEAKHIGTTCEVGWGEHFCWKWHRNVIGQVGEFASNVGDVVGVYFEK